MQRILQGVQRFQSEVFREFRPRFRRLASGQSPRALFITCSDSRIDPSLITQTSPGELFVLRNAGNIVPPSTQHAGGEAATVEYAVSVLRVPHIVVCGHSQCGAMQGLLNPDSLVDLPAVNAWVHCARPARLGLNFRWEVAKQLKYVIENNVRLQLENLHSFPAVREAELRGDLTLHGWIYEFENGTVRILNRETGEFSQLVEDLVMV